MVGNEGREMSMGTNLKSGVIILVFLVGMVSIAYGRTIYVDDDGPADFNTIQAAIDDSNDGDTIIVADGIYMGDGNRDIEFSHGLPEGQTRAITVRSANGPENCIIDCNASRDGYNHHRGFRFISGEDANSVISGFTIINGYAPCEGYLPPLGVCGYIGGAIYCGWSSSPTISNCIFTGNSALDASGSGGGICCHLRSNPTVSNCIFFGNRAIYGGGMSNIFYSSPTVTNCTFSDNLAIDSGGGVNIGSGNPTVTNCILWGNSDSGGTDESAQIYGITDVINYCCIQGLTGALGGNGNIGDDPCFIKPGHWEDPCNTPTMPWDDIWIDGDWDYHLKSQAGRWEPSSESCMVDDVTSPCIDAGDPMSPIGNEPFPNGGWINMGAYGGTTDASKSYFGGPICEIIVAGDINGDCKVNFLDFRIMALQWLRDENQ
jgi:hypothetical protein